MLIVHKPVLLNEVLSVFGEKKDYHFLVDATLGNAGHAVHLIKNKVAEDGVLIGFDQDAKILEIADKRLKETGKNYILINENFSSMEKELSDRDIKGVDGVLMDIGVSSMQLDSRHRGFSFKYDAPLDMRMDIRRSLTAYDVVNGYEEGELKRIFKEYGEIRNAGRISKEIVSAREKKIIRTTSELALALENVFCLAKRRLKINPLTLVFQALRIEVNDELGNLEKGLNQAFSLLNSKGVLAVISFHSLEDRIVKNFFKSKEGICRCPGNMPECVCGVRREGKIINKKPFRAKEEETRGNIRARSARLRGICKV